MKGGEGVGSARRPICDDGSQSGEINSSRINLRDDDADCAAHREGEARGKREGAFRQKMVKETIPCHI